MDLQHRHRWSRQPMGLSRCGSPTTARCGWLLSLGGAATDRLLSRIAAGIDAAVDEVVAFWGTDWSHDIFVVAAGSDEQFHAAAGGVWRRNGRTSPRSRWSTVSILLVARWSANGLCSRRARHT